MAFVRATHECDTPSLESDAPYRLRSNVFDALMLAKGVRTVEEQAERCRVDRATMFRLRSGATSTSLDTAMKLAEAAGTTVEVLFGRQSS